MVSSAHLQLMSSQPFRPKVYCGQLSVEDDAFILFADRLIVTPERVAFELAGEDEGGPFRLDGVAVPAGNGRFVAADVIVHSTRGGRATIHFFNISPEADYCDITGQWSQDGYDGSPWRFEGELDVKD